MAKRLNRLPLLALILAFVPGMACAGTREDVLSNVMRCGAIQDNRTWLDCFYGSAQPLRRELGLPPAPASQTNLIPTLPPSTPAPINSGAPPAAARNGGGFFSGLLGGQTVVNNMPVSTYSFDEHGHLTVTLADGEVWRQIPGDDSLAHWNKPASHYLITIKQGALDSYNLEVADENRLYKVQKVR